MMTEAETALESELDSQPQHFPQANGTESLASKNEPENQGGAKESSFSMNTQEHCQPSITNPCLTATFIGGKDKTIQCEFCGEIFSSTDSMNGLSPAECPKCGEESRLRIVGFAEEQANTTTSGGHCRIRSRLSERK